MATAPTQSSWRLRATRFLVLVGIVLGYASYGVYKLGGPSELYPFFHWRLYSEPLGIDGATTYRVYTQPTPDAAWERHPIRPVAHLDPSRFLLLLGSTSTAFRETPNDVGVRTRLEALAEHAAPGAWRYGIVAETFNPRPLLADPTAYDTTMVYRFDGPRPRARAAE